jgi:hypothetical protein
LPTEQHVGNVAATTRSELHVVEYGFTDWIVGAAGVSFTTAGYNDVAAMYPNLSIYYYWNPAGSSSPDEAPHLV